MKTFFFLLLFALAASAQASQSYWHRETLAVNNAAINASTTNATPGTAYTFDNGEIPHTATIFVRGTGVEATSGGSLTVYVSISPDGTSWNTSTLGKMKVVISTIGAATVQHSEFFNITGARAIRVDRVENTHGGAVSALSVTAVFNSEK